MDLILASTSSYRRELMERLMLPFQCVPPDIDETALPDETPEALVLRLSADRAQAVAVLYPQAFPEHYRPIPVPRTTLRLRG